MAGGGPWRQEYREISVAPGAGVVIDVNSAKEESPASMDASLSVGGEIYNLSYATPGDHKPGLVSQHVFLLNK